MESVEGEEEGCMWGRYPIRSKYTIHWKDTEDPRLSLISCCWQKQLQGKANFTEKKGGLEFQVHPIIVVKSRWQVLGATSPAPSTVSVQPFLSILPWPGSSP